MLFTAISVGNLYKMPILIFETFLPFYPVPAYPSHSGFPDSEIFPPDVDDFFRLFSVHRTLPFNA